MVCEAAFGPRLPHTSLFDLTPSLTSHPASPRIFALQGWSCFQSHVLTSILFTGDGDLIKTILTRLTGRATFPNVILKGNSIGGSDDILALHERGKLATMLRKAGLQIRADLKNLSPP